MAGVAFEQHAIVTFLKSLCAEGDGLIEPNALADDRGFADNDAGAVIDEKIASDVAAG